MNPYQSPQHTDDEASQCWKFQLYVTAKWVATVAAVACLANVFLANMGATAANAFTFFHVGGFSVSKLHAEMIGWGTASLLLVVFAALLHVFEARVRLRYR